MYDKSLSIFSPEGTLSQVEYALEAVKKGGLSIGMVGNKSIIYKCMINLYLYFRQKGH